MDFHKHPNGDVWKYVKVEFTEEDERKDNRIGCVVYIILGLILLGLIAIEK